MADKLRRARQMETDLLPALTPLDRGDNTSSPRPLGARKLYLEPTGRLITGPDVAELRSRLRTLGYISAASETFDRATSEALSRFQSDFGIFNDGVCARVTVVALDYLQDEGVTSANPASAAIRNRINWIASRQRSGMVVVAPYDVSGGSDAHELNLLNSLVLETQHQVESKARLQSLPAPSFLSREERIAFANSIKAEIVVLIGIQDQAHSSSGIRTVYFERSGASSHIGKPLAEYVQHELVSHSGVNDLGVAPEDSDELMRFEAPAIRIELNNIMAAPRRRRLEEVSEIRTVATGVAVGIARLYMLGKRPGSIDDSLNELSPDAEGISNT